jgi:hypothetical protein
MLKPSTIKSLPTQPPKQDPLIEEVDQLATKELNELSAREREQTYYDIHGISEKTNEENPEFIVQRLAQLQIVLDRKIPNKEAYDIALKISPNYVNNRSFRLKFLRSDDFDPFQAAKRLARHFDYKLELFGKELLCKDIEQDDLDEGSLKCLYSGWMQKLPLRDTSGRLVTVAFPRIEGCSDVSNLQKVSNQ